MLLDIIGTGAFRAAAVGAKLGVFEALGGGAVAADDVARAIGADPRAVRILCEALAGFGYLQRTSHGFAIASSAKKWLLADSASSWVEVAQWWDDLVFPFALEHLEETIRSGRPNLTIYEWLTEVPARWSVAQAAFRAYARPIADPIAAALPFPPGARRLLDVGGGHGLYSIALCRRHPSLSATVFDLPEALVSARANISAAEMEGGISVQPGDYRTDSLGTDYDVALLFSILHGHSPKENVSLLAKVAQSLNPGGVVVILDQFAGRGPGRTAKAIGSFFSLVYLVSLGGQTYSEEEITDWLRTAGFSNPRRVKVRKAPGIGILVARNVVSSGS